MATVTISVSGNNIDVVLESEQPTVGQVKEAWATGKGSGYLAINSVTGAPLSDSDPAPANMVLTKNSQNGA